MLDIFLLNLLVNGYRKKKEILGKENKTRHNGTIAVCRLDGLRPGSRCKVGSKAGRGWGF